MPYALVSDTPSHPEATTDELIGRLSASVRGRYVIEGEVGSGGMARVFAAVELATGRRVAVKVLAPVLTACCDIERFRQEMALVGRLRHPNIVPLITECDACDDDRLVFFMMPFIEGASLRARLDGQGMLPVHEVLAILQQVASALVHAHDNGIVHRDIKPENVLMHDGSAMVADFGIAKAVGVSVGVTLSEDDSNTASCHRRNADTALLDGTSFTRAGTFVGTPAYMAPEQLLGESEADHRVDLYALGVLGYELLTGKVPFTANTEHALIAEQVFKTAIPIDQHRAGVPRDLITLITQLMAKEPGQRPTSAHVVVQRLQSGTFA